MGSADQNKKHIVLVGMMGAGKTTFGKKLASRLEIPFYDSDVEIEEQIGHSVSWIFENVGEAEFRKLEVSTIKSLLERDEPSIMGLGGGAFLNEETRGNIEKSGFSVWLKLSEETIFKRVSARKGRPLLDSAEDLMTKIQTLSQEREKIYALADKMVVTENRSHTDIVNELFYIAQENLDEVFQRVY